MSGDELGRYFRVYMAMHHTLVTVAIVVTIDAATIAVTVTVTITVYTCIRVYTGCCDCPYTTHRQHTHKHI